MNAYPTEKQLKPYAAFLMIFPLFYSVGIFLCFDIPFYKFFQLLLSPFYYLISAGIIFTGLGLWHFKRWSWYALLTSQIGLALFNIGFIDESDSHYPFFYLIISFILQFIFIARIGQLIRVPYLYPSIRWWENDPRFRGNIPVTISLSEKTIDSDILDLSFRGCYIKKTTEEILEKQEVVISFKSFGKEVECSGTVVWVAPRAVTRPAGIGIQFINISKTQKKVLKSISKRLKKIDLFYKRNRYLMNLTEFSKKYQDFYSHFDV